jgi:hypothetical protein
LLLDALARTRMLKMKSGVKVKEILLLEFKSTRLHK